MAKRTSRPTTANHGKSTKAATKKGVSNKTTTGPQLPPPPSPPQLLPMPPGLPRRSCFVAMPFGNKHLHTKIARRSVKGKKVVEFDDVYRLLIAPALEAAGLNPNSRADHSAKPGMITHEMFRRLRESDVVIVDGSTQNANVYYELGIRHAMRSGVTVLLNGPWTDPPFDIQGVKRVEYNLDSEVEIKYSINRVVAAIKAGLENAGSDSPIFDYLTDLRKGEFAERLTKSTQVEYRLKRLPELRLGLFTGDISFVRDVDIWVNSENTDMEMDRHHGNSLSATIRFLGAKKDPQKLTIEDTVYNELQKAKAGRESVRPATVLRTTGGALQKSHGVKAILHVATAQGSPGRGYVPVSSSDTFVNNLLDYAATELPECRSIVMPLFGTGVAGGDMVSTARSMINAIINWFETKPRRFPVGKSACKLTAAYIVVAFDRPLEVCLKLLNSREEIEKVEEIESNVERPGTARRPPSTSARPAARRK
jgi:O-acetyl-ADP-ribose deacetylase (regulator of RNase III)